MSEAPSPTRLVVSPGRSRVAVRTRAKGLLARLAHDLELASGEVDGEVDLDAPDGSGWTARLRLPIASLRVAGTLHGDRLDADGLSASDRAEIERRVRDEVLHFAREIEIRASGRDRASGEATVEIGAGHRQTTRLTLRTETQAHGGLRVSGGAHLSLARLGVGEVRGPLGAFRIDDALEVRFEATLAPG